MCINARRNDGQYGRSATGLPQAFRLQIPPQRRAAYSQHFGGDLPAATRPGQGFIERRPRRRHMLPLDGWPGSPGRCKDLGYRFTEIAAIDLCRVLVLAHGGGQALRHLFQFPNIARPAVAEQCGQSQSKNVQPVCRWLPSVQTPGPLRMSLSCRFRRAKVGVLPWRVKARRADGSLAGVARGANRQETDVDSAVQR